MSETTPGGESSEQKSLSFTQAVEAAESALAETPVSAQESGVADEKALAEPVTPETPPESDHIRWAKSVQGNVDDKGQLNVDRVVKQAYELNRLEQKNAQNIARIQQLLASPRVREALEAELRGDKPVAAKPAETEKSEEQILREFVESVLEEKVRPLRETNQQLYQKHMERTLTTTVEQLNGAFGKTEDGTPVYQTIRDEVGSRLNAVAQKMGTDVLSLMQTLVQRDMLYPTLESIAKEILYPKLTEQLQTLQKKSQEDNVNKKKGANLPGKGSSAASMQRVREVKTFADAVAAAEDENPAFRKLN